MSVISYHHPEIPKEIIEAGAIKFHETWNGPWSTASLDARTIAYNEARAILDGAWNHIENWFKEQFHASPPERPLPPEPKVMEPDDIYEGSYHIGLGPLHIAWKRPMDDTAAWE